MTWTWQDIFALSIVCGAIAYVANCVFQRLRRRDAGACGGGCFGCRPSDPEATPLVTGIGMSESVGKQRPRVD